MTSRHKYCAACRDNATREYILRTRELRQRADTPEKRRARRSREDPSPEEKQRRAEEYGTAHRKERRRWEALVGTGDVMCARCGQAIEPGAPWHLDHADDRESYLGPSHSRCNLSAATGRDLTPAGLAERRAKRAAVTEKAAPKHKALYAKEHGRRRAQLAPKVALGTVRCVRCGELIGATDPWDLGHDDLDWSTYYGPEHRSCNRSAGAKKRNGTYEAVTSRRWPG